MAVLVSAYIPFPNIYWWLQAMQTDSILLDGHEHFQKMSYRNRYYISGSNGLIQLSIPLASGRNQRSAMKDTGISNAEAWQVQHWRTIVSVYGRAPYFAHYEPELKPLFDQSFTELATFNRATIEWLKKQLKLNKELVETERYRNDYGTEAIDLRSIKPGIEKQAIENTGLYYQIFEERTGFLPNLSMLDLLFSEGPYALQWTKQHSSIVNEWGNYRKG